MRREPITPWKSLCLSAILLGGCAPRVVHAKLSYHLIDEPTNVASAASPHFEVEVSDHRPTQNLGHANSGIGLKVADITADNDLAAILKNAFEMELKNRGFVAEVGGTSISVQIDNLHYQGWFGLLAQDTSASMGMEVIVKRRDGTIAYEKYVTGQHRESENAAPVKVQDTINSAIQDAVLNAFSDSAFIDSLK